MPEISNKYISNGGSYKVLLVDDEAMRTIKRHLEVRGFEVLGFENGQETLEFMKERREGDIDFIILDYMLPGIDGVMLFQEMKERFPWLPPAMILTAHPNTGSVINFFRDKGFHYMLKPVNYDDLARIIKQGVELHRMGKKLEAAEREREIMMRAREETRRVMNRLTHSLRNPLTTVRGFAEQIIKEADKPDCNMDDLRSWAETVYRNSQKVLGMIEKTLILAGIENGTSSIKKESVDIMSLIEEVIERMGPVVKRKNVVVESHCFEDIPKIMADKTLLYITLCDLLDNAIKFSPAESVVSLIVSVRSDKGLAQDDLLITIQDQGPGVPKGEEVAIFEQYRRGSNAGTFPGTGQGLTICKQIIGAHEGEIWAANLNGGKGGAVFSFALPISSNT